MNFEDHWQSIRSKPTFVVMGVQGSGTNLTANILENVFGVSIVRDRSLILGTATSVSGVKDIAAAKKSVFQRIFPGPVRKRLLSRQWYHQAKNYAGLDQHLDSVKIESASQFADFFYSYHAFVAGMSERGIKSDDCWQHVDHFDSVLPNRRSILVVRDPRDNANSIMHKDFGPRTAYTASKFVAHQLKIYIKEIDSRPELSTIANYETMLQNPIAFVENFSKLSGIPIPKDVDERIQNLRIRTQNFDKWKKWKDADIAASESVLQAEISRLGYELSGEEIKPIDATSALKHRAVDLLQRVPQRLKTTWEHKILAK